MAISLQVRYALTLLIFTATGIAKLVAASASHVKTSFAFLYPILALSASLCSYFLRPLLELDILWNLTVVNFLPFCFNFCTLLFILELFAALINMIHNLTCEAVLYPAEEANVIRIAFIISEEKVVTSVWWALFHVWVLITDFFPFKFLTALPFFFGQKFVKIR